MSEEYDPAKPYRLEFFPDGDQTMELAAIFCELPPGTWEKHRGLYTARSFGDFVRVHARRADGSKCLVRLLPNAFIRQGDTIKIEGTNPALKEPYIFSIEQVAGREFTLRRDRKWRERAQSPDALPTREEERLAESWAS